MKKKTGKTVFLLCNLYVSAVVGAGFATGQEIMRFFSCYGPYGFLGVLLTGVLFMVVAPLMLRKTIVYDAYSMGELLSFRFGKNAETAMKIMHLFLEFSIVSVMMAGLRTLLHQMGMSNVLAIVMLVIMLYAVSFHKEAALRMNNILTPVVILGIWGTCGMLLLQKGSWNGWHAIEMMPVYPWWVSALLYAGFNLLLAMPALCLAGKSLQREHIRTSVVGSVLGGLLILGMTMVSQCVLFAYGDQLGFMQMPVVELVTQRFPKVGQAYQGIIFAAMASSAVICIRCIVDLFPHRKKKKNDLVTGLICVLAGAVSLLDFSQLISVLYPLFGCVGILAVLAILW